MCDLPTPAQPAIQTTDITKKNLRMAIDSPHVHADAHRRASRDGDRLSLLSKLRMPNTTSI